MSEETSTTPQGGTDSEEPKREAESAIPAMDPLDWLYRGRSLSSISLDVLRGSGPYRLSDLQAASSLQRLQEADKADVQAIAASQIELLGAYYNLVLDQARRSFRSALAAAGIGLLFFLGAVGLLLYQQPTNVAVVSLIGGSLVEVISGINFYLYAKTSAQLAEFQTRLDVTQRYLLANSMCESLEGDFKHKARWELIRSIGRIGPDQVSSSSKAEHGQEDQ